MAPQPPRREQRRIHLDASVKPVEQALLARAAKLETGHGDHLDADVADGLALEFRALAEELHFW